MKKKKSENKELTLEEVCAKHGIKLIEIRKTGCAVITSNRKLIKK